MINQETHQGVTRLLTGKLTGLILLCCLWFLSAPRAEGQVPDSRSGVTMLFGAGFGAGSAGDGYGVGFAGPSFGIGVYLDQTTAAMIRFNRIHTDLEDSEPYRSDYSATSYFLGPGIQFLVRDDFPVEVAAGIGIWGDTPETDAETLAMFALQLGLGNTLYSNANYNIAFNLQYLPFFDTASGNSYFLLHNMMVGFQIQSH